MSFTTDAVLARYDEVVALVDSVAGRPAGDPELSRRVASVLAHEARLLDEARFDAWLDQWTDDAVLWVPHGVAVHPGRDQSLYLDDRRRIGERIQWRGEPSAWGQQPPSTTVRVLGVVEAWHDADRVVARSALVLHEQRRGRVQQLAGHQVHELVGHDLRRRTKVLLFPQLELGVRNPSFLL
jgi:3-phenylpropionate/cinnamic acid dioxygenase small subunit